MNQDGILRGTNYKNYSVLFNGNYKLSEAWSLSTKASLQVRDAVGGGNTVNTISRSILTPPTLVETSNQLWTYISFLIIVYKIIIKYFQLTVNSFVF